VLLAEGELQRMKLVPAGESLDGLDARPVGLGSKHEARLRRTTVDEQRAHPAHTLLASDVGAVQADVVTDEVHEQRPRLDVADDPLAVDRDVDRHALGH
jgi:hypothetical protein